MTLVHSVLRGHLSPRPGASRPRHEAIVSVKNREVTHPVTLTPLHNTKAFPTEGTTGATFVHGEDQEAIRATNSNS